MIPVPLSVCTKVDLEKLKNSPKSEDVQYYQLCEKEYQFCLAQKSSIISKANCIYDKQKEEQRVLPFHCNFMVLEDICDNYIQQKSFE